MSIYNPPSKTQDIFNPSNYEGLGAGGQITTDYLDANFLSFPVAQGNTTLVGTSVLGDITQQGDLTTTGDITGDSIEGTSFLVGTTNIITEMGTKQDTIQDGDLTIAKTSGLQSALDNKYDDTGGSITGNVDITGNLLVNDVNIINEIGTKQDTIEDGDLTIAKASGLQDALDSKFDDTGGAISGSVDITGDLVVGTTNIITEIGTKQDTITTTTYLTLNSITTEDLIVNENLNVDNAITYETNEFITLVIRRFNESTTLGFNLNELQIWVNDENIMPSNISLLDAYFANWSNKDTPLTTDTIQGVVRDVNN